MLRSLIPRSRLVVPGLVRSTPRTVRTYSTVEPMDEYETKIYGILQQQFSPSNLSVKDVSGGCGSMFAILIESEKFKGIPMIKQHRLVNETLKDEIKNWHGLQLKTKAS
ncbi:Altered inheritance of mitochondria protein 1 [Spathaspora sp. JA1]|nr:Altered inheritance of mitochondria protein 1 [Spathaspora sp. JA1]